MWGQGSKTWDTPTLRHPPPTPIALPCMRPWVPAWEQPWCPPSTSHVELAAGGRLTAPTPRAPALPLPGEPACFPVCLSPSALILGQGHPGCCPVGARSHPRGVIRGFSRVHIFLVVLPPEGLEPCTQPCFAARSVSTLSRGAGDESGWWRRTGRLQEPRSC